MRIYGVRSGRNNLPRYMARGYVRGTTRPKVYSKTQLTIIDVVSGIVFTALLFGFEGLALAWLIYR